VIIPFILGFPMGLMLYWATTNLWTVGQGLVTRRLVPRKPMPPPKRTSRTPARGEEAQGDGEVAKAVQPSRAATPGQQRVRRRKKKGPRSRR
jgi:YidC/Oxa1 family membrane protein insertase